jgi:hypothetical protein
MNYIFTFLLQDGQNFQIFIIINIYFIFIILSIFICPNIETKRNLLI